MRSSPALPAEFDEHREDVLLSTAVGELRRAYPEFSAATLPPAALVVVALMLLAAPALLVGLAPRGPLATLLLTLPFACIVLIRIEALCHWPGNDSAGCRSPDAEAADGTLPPYSLLVPLCREAAAVDGLVAALAALDYPRDRLEIFFVIEADDVETRAALDAAPLAAHMRVVTVPQGLPRTKPRALNYALAFARGDLVAIYDAEDQPAADQLRQAAVMFASHGMDLACVQAPLSIYNDRENRWTRQFALEYAALFDAVLPALKRMNLPLPLGGTSNHFRRAHLQDCGGWDPFNVTEDADLGFRLARLGFEVGLISSTTLEEAPHTLKGWFRQRTRWLKGWIITYLVHMRAPRQLLADLGAWRFAGFQAVLAGMIASALVHPWFYVAIAYAALSGNVSWPDIRVHPFATTVTGLCLVTLLISYTVSMALGVLARRRRGLSTSAGTLMFLPAYWLMISAAAYCALFELIVRPHHWAKTEHRGIGAAISGGR